jgi:hypothetical protein
MLLLTLEYPKISTMNFSDTIGSDVIILSEYLRQILRETLDYEDV